MPFSDIIGQSVRAMIPFGTDIIPEVQVERSRKLASLQTAASREQYKKKGDYKRLYFFPDANVEIPYRVYIPESWDQKSKLPMVVFLHGAWNDESSYLDANEKQMLTLAEENGFLLVSPLGYNSLGGYGQCLTLPGLFGNTPAIKKQIAGRTPQRNSVLEWSEKDVINVVELVLKMYPVDTTNVFLTGHSMGAGGTLYLGAKYHYWRALAPMSGPFADEELYPWSRISKMPVFLSEGTQATASLESSRKMAAWLKKEAFDVEYKEVAGDHGGMVPQILPDVFSFFKKLVTEEK